MGHLRLGRLPLHYNWQQVVAALGNSATGPGEIAAVTARAAAGGLKRAADDPGVAYPFWFLLQLADHSRNQDAWSGFLQSHDVAASDTAVEFQSAVAEHVRRASRVAGRRSAFGDIALESLRATLKWAIGGQEISLFGASADDMRLSLRSASAARGFGRLSARYLGDFYARCLSYFISFEISNHLGAKRRFRSLAGAEEFAESLRTYAASNSRLEKFAESLQVYASDVSRLAEDFSSGWYFAERWRSGDVTPDATRRFLHVAFRKFRQQLERELQ